MSLRGPVAGELGIELPLTREGLELFHTTVQDPRWWGPVREYLEGPARTDAPRPPREAREAPAIPRAP